MTDNTSPQSFPTIKKFIPGIAWFFVVLALLCTPGQDFPDVGDWFGEINADKLIHAGIFFVLGFLWMYPVGNAAISPVSKRHWFIKIMISISIFGFISELLQLYFIPNRSFSLLDAAADIAGAVFAFVGCNYYFFNRKKRILS